MDTTNASAGLRRLAMRDEGIIEALRNGPPDKALTTLYAHLPKVERMARNHGGTRAAS